jgi:predicted NAD/FAD-binding protein
MRIGIIGAGAAGLTACWLLSENHDVTLFERQDRLGGHAHTVEVEQNGKLIPIEAGFEFVMDSMFPTFIRLLGVLDVKIHRYPLSAVLYTTDGCSLTMMPPFNSEGIVWSALKPYQVGNLLQLLLTMTLAQRLMDSHDTSITIEKYIDSLPVLKGFKNQFLYPFLQAQWCVELEEFKQFAAYNALKYATMNMNGLNTPTGVEIVGGTQAYIKALAQASPRAHIKIAADIAAITYSGNQYSVRETNGQISEFDHLIIATSPWDAARLLTDIDEVETRRQELSRFDSFKTVIAVHGDRRLMPAQEKHWAVTNMRYDGAHCQITVWKKWKSEHPIFRSWVTFDRETPDSLYQLVDYQHVKINLNYYQAQKKLIAQQGDHQLWLAGLYMHDIDSHESAIMSAVNIARRLDPKSVNLGKLDVG